MESNSFVLKNKIEEIDLVQHNIPRIIKRKKPLKRRKKINLKLNIDI